MLIKKSQRQFFDMNYIDIKISVIIPIFNDELYLHDALKSIQNQSFKDFECICVNDGSIDKSEEIIDGFVNNDSRFIKINRNNGGVSAARNSGLNVAKGQYIFMMDHDDLIPDYTLQKLLEAAIEFNADMSRGRFMMIPEDFRLNQLPPTSIQNSRPLYFQNPLLDFYKIARKKYKLLRIFHIFI
ncbi:MAG: glycosyltransferase family 2 protein [Bacteroidota bacterium]|jgi:glycosyltransferase involved in cell wall biosynthesis